MQKRSVVKETDVAMEVLQQFRLIFGSMRQYFRLVEERCGIPGSHMWVLQEVGRTPSLGVSDLAARMGIHQSTCSLLVDKLVAQGYLAKARRTNDLRRVGLSLSVRGEAALAALPGPAEGLLPQALSEMPMVVLKTLKINLDELIRHLPGKHEDSAGMPLADMLGKSEQGRR